MIKALILAVPFVLSRDILRDLGRDLVRARKLTRDLSMARKFTREINNVYDAAYKADYEPTPSESE
jgi:hypothetical protein